MRLLKELKHILEDAQVSDAMRKAVYHADYVKRHNKKKKRASTKAVS